MNLNYKIATLAFSCAVVFSSCADFLDEKPYGQFTADQVDDTSIEGLLMPDWKHIFSETMNHLLHRYLIGYLMFARMMLIKVVEG